MAADLPDDIISALEYLAMMARGYDNNLKWNEEAKLKADLMTNRRYWTGFPPAAVRAKCLELGMTAEDARTIAEFVTKAQAGRRLVPASGYRDYVFAHDRDEPTTFTRGTTLTDW